MALRCCGGFRERLIHSLKPLVPATLVSTKTLSVPSRKLSKGTRYARAEGDGRSFFSKLLDLNVAGSLAPLTAAHSKVLTEGSTIYELQCHYVKPKAMDEYKGNAAELLPKLHNDAEYPGKLVGSWTTQFGELDQAVHMWKYPGGYKAVSSAKKLESSNQTLSDFDAKCGCLLKRREHQLLQAFHFWGEPQERQPEHIYELRSYSLKPGTMIEWGNNWGRAIKIRQQDAVGGFFSQIGELYQVHHIWAYKDLHHRKEAREIMWQEPGWDDCVANTVPLINKMEARLLVPLPFSPMQ